MPGEATIVAVRVHRLTHRYADGQVALEGVSFEIAAGERVALVGPNGAGKTTLFLRLCGVLVGKPGEVAIHGLDPADAEQRRQLPHTVGVVFQNPDDQLFSSTVLEDVAFGPLNLHLSAAEAETRAREALAAVGLSGCEQRSPDRKSVV